MKLLECVPNFSEGRDINIINKISGAIAAVNTIKILHTDIGEAANRTVITFIGEPEAVIEAAFQAIKTAGELIDMTKHQGVHPRIGATDVCPLIPLKGITMEETIEFSKKLAKRVSKELHIPVYLYENSATAPHRKNLADIRKGEFEGLEEKMKQPEWQPDFGFSIADFRLPNLHTHQSKIQNPKSKIAGATVIGARNFLVAFNVNLDTQDVSIAKKIAAEMRESGIQRKEISELERHVKNAKLENEYLEMKVKRLKLLMESLKMSTEVEKFHQDGTEKTDRFLGHIEKLELNAARLKQQSEKMLKTADKLKYELDLSRLNTYHFNLLSVKAIGWYIEEYNRAQVSMNLTDTEVTSVHIAYEMCKKAAEKYGVKVTGSELIGLIQEQVLVDAGMFYSKNDENLDVDEFVDLGVVHLGLNDLKPFDVEERVIDYLI